MSAGARQLKATAYVGGLGGLILLIVLMVRSDLTGMLHTTARAGWPLLWLLPYRTLFFLLYAIGWWLLLRPYDADRRITLIFMFWVTCVREAIDRLLPVASVGGGVVGVRLLRWVKIGAGPAAASVITEILLTLLVVYLFAVMGLLLLLRTTADGRQIHQVLIALALSFPVPLIMFFALRQGSIFARLENQLRPFVGVTPMSEGALALDQELRRTLLRKRTLGVVGALQLTALISGSFEVWLALRLFGHPLGVAGCLILESMSQALRHLAFLVPAGVGVQEAGLVIFGHILGVSSELALGVSLAKRVREVFLGVPTLISWQWMEARQLRGELGHER